MLSQGSTEDNSGGSGVVLANVVPTKAFGDLCWVCRKRSWAVKCDSCASNLCRECAVADPNKKNQRKSRPSPSQSSPNEDDESSGYVCKECRKRAKQKLMSVRIVAFLGVLFVAVVAVVLFATPRKHKHGFASSSHHF